MLYFGTFEHRREVPVPTLLYMFANMALPSDYITAGLTFHVDVVASTKAPPDKTF